MHLLFLKARPFKGIVENSSQLLSDEALKKEWLKLLQKFYRLTPVAFY